MNARLLAAAFVCAAGGLAQAQANPTTTPAPTHVAARVSATAFMSGHWLGELGGGLSEEIWTTPAGGSMLGMWRLVIERPRVLELLAISEEGGTLVMRLRHFDERLVAREDKASPVEMRLTSVAENEAVFEGAHADGRKLRLEYRRSGPDRLTAVLVRGAERDEFSYRRAPATR